MADNDSSTQSDNQKPSDDDKSTPEKRRHVRTVLLVVAIAAVIVGGSWFLYYEFVGKYFESTNDAYIDADSVTISPKVGGYVEQVLVNDNEDVKAGQPLVRIDPRDYKAQAAQFLAQIDIAKANADAIRSQISEQESVINEMKAQYQAAQKNADFAAGEVKRYEPLVKIGAETAEQLAAKRNQAQQAAEQAKAQNAALINAQRRIASLRAQIRQADAQASSAGAQLASANVSLQSTVVTASFAGRVGDKTVRIGQFVQPGTRMMTIVPLNKLYITANFKETQIGRMRSGQPVEIEIDALSGLKLHGHVESISPGTGAQFSLLPPQNATGNFTKIVQRVPVRIALDAGAETLRVLVPGLSTTVKVDTRSAKDAITRIRVDEQARKERRQ
jgi:membrane fusion protein (multidrug efflux system)